MKDIILLLRISYLILALPFLIRIKNLPDLCKYLTPRNIKTNDKKGKIIKYTDFLLGYKIPIFKKYCLRRSLILYNLLRESGINVIINFGIRKDRKGKLIGHSWLTLDGKVYLEDERITEKLIRIDYVFPC